MITTTFNPLTYFEELRAAGVSEPQAKVQADTLNKIIDGELATKKDLKELEYKLTIRLGGMIVASTSILGFLIKF